MNSALKKTLVVAAVSTGSVAAGAVALTAVGAVALTAAWVMKPRRLPKGSVVLVTGGSRGLGYAIAEQFGRNGARLVLTARNQDELEAARQSLTERGVREVIVVAADLTDEHEAQRVAVRAVEVFGRIDVLVNNAGIIQVGPVESQTPEDYEKAMATNFHAAVNMTYAVLPDMLARRSAGETECGRIVNIASIGGKFAMPHMLPYVSSKFALVGFSEGLHAELQHKGICVTTVCPGLMRTGGEAHAHFTGRKDQEQAWFNFGAKTPVISASVKYAARKIARAVAEGRAEITITPQAWVAARVAGLAPETTQWAAGMVNRYVLPSPPEADVALAARPFWANELQSTADED